MRKNVPRIVQKYKNGTFVANDRSRSRWIQGIKDVELQFQQQFKFRQKDYSIYQLILISNIN